MTQKIEALNAELDRINTEANKLLAEQQKWLSELKELNQLYRKIAEDRASPNPRMIDVCSRCKKLYHITDMIFDEEKRRWVCLNCDPEYNDLENFHVEPIIEPILV